MTKNDIQQVRVSSSSNRSVDEVLGCRVDTWHIWTSLSHQFPFRVQSLTVSLWAKWEHAAANSRWPASNDNTCKHTHCTEDCCLAPIHKGKDLDRDVSCSFHKETSVGVLSDYPVLCFTLQLNCLFYNLTQRLHPWGPTNMLYAFSSS